MKLALLGCERMAAALVSFLWRGWSVHMSADPMLWQCWMVWFKMLFSHVVKFASYAGVPASCISFHEQNMIGEDELTLPPDYFITYLHIGPTSSMHFLDAPFQEENESKPSWSQPYVHRASSKKWYWNDIEKLWEGWWPLKKHPSFQKHLRCYANATTQKGFLLLPVMRITGGHRKKSYCNFHHKQQLHEQSWIWKRNSSIPKKVDKKSTEYCILVNMREFWASFADFLHQPWKKGPFHPSSWR